jgi:hypothetical protein
MKLIIKTTQQSIKISYKDHEINYKDHTAAWWLAAARHTTTQWGGADRREKLTN